MQIMLYILPASIVGFASWLFISGALDRVFARFGIQDIAKQDASQLLTRTGLEGSPVLAISFIATQLTVTAGVAATMSGIAYYGLWFFLAPLSFVLGILCFYVVYARTAADNAAFITRQPFLRSPVMQMFGLCALVINLFLIGWEFFVLSQLFVSYYASIGGGFGEAVASNSIIVILILAAIAAWYTSKGGWDRSVKTDIAQFIGILFFLILLVPLGINGGRSPLELVQIESRATELEIVLFVLPLLIINLSFPFVTISNWQIAQSARERLPVVLGLGCLGLLMFTLFVGWLSLNMSGTDPRSLFTGRNVLAALLVALSPMFTWSTVDTTIVSLANMGVKILQRENVEPSAKEMMAQLALKYGTSAIIFSSVFVALLLNSAAPNIVQALFAGTGALSIFAPVFILSLLSPRNTRFVHSKYVAFALGALFLITLVLGISILLNGGGPYVTVPAISAVFLICLVLSVHLYRRGRAYSP